MSARRWALIGVPLALLALVLAGMAVRAVATPTPPMPAWINRTAVARGADDFATGSCISCHTISGVSNAGGGANLTHEGSRRSVPWLLREIAHPTSPRPPTPPGQLHDLVAYLSSKR